MIFGQGALAQANQYADGVYAVENALCEKV